MQISETFTDERSGYAAVAAETVAHGGVFVSDSLTGWNSVELPNTSTLTDPALLSVCRSNPNSGLFAFVVYEQRPLGFEIVDVFVGNGDLSDRVYNNQVVILKHELGANPEQNRTDGNGGTEAVLEPLNGVFDRVQNHLSHEQSIKHDGHYGPGEVALGSEDKIFIHASIIAGIAAVQEGK